MKKPLLFFLLLFTIGIQAQNWAPVGAKWYYNQFTYNPNYVTYTLIESIGDTTILGVNCRILKETNNLYYPSQLISYRYMYQSHDSVYWYFSNKFCLLYAFDTPAGDSIVSPCYNQDSLKVSVDSTDLIVLGGVTRKVQYVFSNHLGGNFQGAHIEGIGNNFFMFPVGDMSSPGPLRCYVDSSGLISFSSFACDTSYYTGINQSSFSKTYLTVSPNPATSSITLQMPQLESDAEVCIFNSLGEQVLKTKVHKAESEARLDVAHLPAGLYFVKMNNYLGKFVKQN